MKFSFNLKEELGQLNITSKEVGVALFLLVEV